MRNMHDFMIAAIAAMALGGCTDLRATKAGPGKDGMVPSGLVYHLPAKALDVRLDFEFSDCTLAAGKPQLNYTLTPTVTERLIADPSQAYVIDYEALDGLTKTTNLDIKLFDNATMKSVNLTQDDRTGQILLDVVKTGFNIASTVVTGGALGMGAPGETPICGPVKANAQALDAAKKALKAAQAHDEQLAAAKGKVDVAKAAFEAAKAAVKAAKADGDDDAKAAAKADLLKADADLKAAAAAAKALGEAQTAAAAKAVAAAKAAVTRSVTVTWLPERPSSGSPFANLSVLLPTTALEGIIDATAAERAEISLKADIVMAVPAPQASGKLQDNGSGGIVYRQPVPAKLYVCDMGTEKWCSDEATKTLNTAALRLDTVTTVPQFGLLATLPLHNGAFADNTLTLALTETGTVTSLGFKSSARAERAAAAAQEASAGALAQMTSLTKLIGERKAANRQEQLADQEFIKKLAEAQRAAELAKAGVVDQSAAQTQATDQKVKEIEAQIKLIEAQARLDAAKAAVSP